MHSLTVYNFDHCAVSDIPLISIYKKTRKRQILLLSRIEKKDRSVRQGIRALKNCAAFGQSTKAARKNKKYATQVVRRAKQAKEKVTSAC